MNKFNKNHLLIALIVICIGLLLWIEPGKNSILPARGHSAISTQPEEESAVVSPLSANYIEENENNIEGNHSIQVPDSWKEEIDEYNSIDAAITVSDCIRENGFRKSYAEIVDINQEKILAFLEDYYHPHKEIDDEYVIQYLGNDDMYLYFFKDTYSGAEASMTTAFGNYVNMAYRDTVYDGYNRDLYPINEELENFTIDDCDDMISDFCESLGINDEIEIIHRTLDYKLMESEAAEQQSGGIWTKPDYQWTPNDSSYYCTISQLCNGIAVIPSYLIEISGDILNQGGFTCLLNNERIAMFYIGDKIYDIRYGDDYEDLLEFSDIVEKYKQYVTLGRQDYKTVVTDITIRVFAIKQGDGNYKMIPIWVFNGYWSVAADTTEDVTGNHTIFINAITGERL